MDTFYSRLFSYFLKNYHHFIRFFFQIPTFVVVLYCCCLFVFEMDAGVGTMGTDGADAGSSADRMAQLTILRKGFATFIKSKSSNKNSTVSSSNEIDNQKQLLLTQFLKV
jgi:hypothetical protein